MDRLEGGYLGAKPSWSTAASPGVWTLSQALARRVAGTWPATSSLFDPYFESVSLLLHMNGSNGSTTFVDSSLGNLAVTANGNAQISTAQSKFGGSSGTFDGTGDWLYSPAGTGDFNSGDFTIEGWYRFNSTAFDGGLFHVYPGTPPGGVNGLAVGFNNTNVLYIYTGGTYVSRTYAIQVNTWYHIALVRSNGSLTLYVNGIAQGASIADATFFGGGNGVNVGLYYSSSYTFNGYIDEFRVTRGVARYTANFTVPGNAGPDEGAALYDPYFDYVSLLLRCNGENNSTTFTDSSNNALAITRNGDTKISTTQARFGGASAYFDGTGDYLSIASNATFDVLSGDSTVEFWFKHDNPSDTIGSAIVCVGQSSGYWQIIIRNGSIVLNSSPNGSTFNSYSATQALDTRWHHFAWTKQGNTHRLFYDGALLSATGTAPTSTASNALYIGANYNGGTTGFNGYIDDLRITKGVARYTTSFRPVGPYATSGKLVDPYLTSTSLLLPMTGDNGTTSFFDRSNNFLRATENGNAKVSTTISKFGAGAAYFDGTGDYLTSSAPNLSGSWTVECWLYPTTASQQTFISFNNGSNTGINLWFNSSLQLVVDDGANAQSAFTGGTLSLNSWNHVAIVRSGTTTSGYINGVLVGSNSFTPQTTSVISIGRYNGGVNFYYFVGYIDDVRLTNGTARYTSAFTPPERAFNDEAFNDPHYNAVSLLLHMDGTNNSTTFTDSSVNGLTVTANGDAKISTAQSRFGGASAVFDGTGDYLSIPSTAMIDGTQNFTIEWWQKLPSTTTTYSLARFSTINGLSGIKVGNGTMQLYVEVVGGINIVGNVSLSTEWQHIAICRSSSVVKMFVNGQESSLTTNTTPGYSFPSTALDIGRGWTGYGYVDLNGYIDELRITKGIARYTSNFTPPTLPFYNTTIPTVDSSFSSVSLLLHMNGSNGSTTFTDSSSNVLTVTANGNAQISTAQSKFGGASGAFDGTGDWLDIASTALFAFGTGDFTLETWVRTSVTITSNTIILDFRNATSADPAQPVLYINSSQKPIAYTDGGGNMITGSTSITAGTWFHLAVVKQSGKYYLYVNGVSEGGVANNSSSVPNSKLRIGSDYTGVGSFNGYIDDLRITKGVARYTSNFYIPRAAFPDA